MNAVVIHACTFQWTVELLQVCVLKENVTLRADVVVVVAAAIVVILESNEAFELRYSNLACALYETNMLRAS